MHKQRWLRVLALMLVMALLLAACGGADTGDDTGDDTGGDTGSDTASALYSDDFSDPNSGWEVGEYGTGNVGYTGGEYFVLQFGGSDFMWGQPFGEAYSDVDIRADAYQLNGPGNDNTGYGLMCRVGYDPNTDELTGYWFGIGADGYYSIHKFTATEIVALVDWSQSSVINLGNNAVNQLRVVCAGNNLQFYVNGELVAQVNDSDYGSGDFGLGGVSFEDQQAEFRFDNFEVFAP